MEVVIANNVATIAVDNEVVETVIALADLA